MKLRALLISALLLLATPLSAERKKMVVPPDMHVQQVPFSLGCFKTVGRMSQYLWKTYGELPEIYMEFNPGVFDGYIYTNDDHTTLSMVIHKIGTEVCVVWGAYSPDGLVLNPVMKPDRATLPPMNPPGDAI